MANIFAALIIALLFAQPALAAPATPGEYPMKCTNAYMGPLDPGQKRELDDMPSSTCYEWAAPYITPRFRQFYPPTGYVLHITTTWTGNTVYVMFLVSPINESKRLSGDVSTTIGLENGKWADVHEVAIVSRAALKQSMGAVMEVCDQSPSCDIFKMQSKAFGTKIRPSDFRN